MSAKNFKDQVRRISDLQTMRILSSVEEAMIVGSLQDYHNIYVPVIREMKGLVTLLNKGLVIDDGKTLKLSKRLHRLLNMELNTLQQNTEYQNILAELVQTVKGVK